MSIFRNRLFMSAGIGHMVLDIFNSAGPVIVAFLSASLGLNNTLIAIAIGTYQLVGAFSQPIFGWVADRYGGVRLMGLSVIWTVGFLMVAVFAAQTGVFWLFLVPYVLASLGSAAFHPIGTKYSALTATTKAATYTAFFFLFGQFGLALGPFLSGFVLDNIGIIGLPLMAALVVPLLWFVTTAPVPVSEQKRSKVQAVRDEVEPPKSITSSLPWKSLIILIFHVLCRSWTQNGTISFLPKLFQDKGWSATSYGALLSTMWIASAIAGVLAGNAADRWGRRQVIMVVMLLAIVPLYLLPATDVRYQAFFWALLVGGLTGAPHSITVVIAQGLMPGKQATASGIILGLIFGLGSVATFTIGWLADSWGLATTLQMGALMALLAALSALALPKTSTVTTPVAEGETVKR